MQATLEKIEDAITRLQDVNRQLAQRAHLYELVQEKRGGHSEVADEFRRISRVEILPILNLLDTVYAELKGQ